MTKTYQVFNKYECSYLEEPNGESLIESASTPELAWEIAKLYARMNAKR